MNNPLKQTLSVIAGLSVDAMRVSGSALRRRDLSVAAWVRRAKRAKLIFRGRVFGDRQAQWDETYYRCPPWFIDHPQPVYVDLLNAGAIVGSVLDVGCGAGQFVQLLLSRNRDALGVDISHRAIQLAKESALARGLDADAFRVADVLEPGSLDRAFDTVTDSALFHCFSDQDRTRYAANLCSLVRPKGTLFVLAFSDREPADWGGPLRISQSDFLSVFPIGWRINWIRGVKYETTLPQHISKGGAEAWLACIERLPAAESTLPHQLP